MIEYLSEKSEEVNKSSFGDVGKRSIDQLLATITRKGLGLSSDADKKQILIAINGLAERIACNGADDNLDSDGVSHAKEDIRQLLVNFVRDRGVLIDI